MTDTVATAVSLPPPSIAPSARLEPRAPWRDVLVGRAPLVGARVPGNAPRGRFSPLEARLALGLGYGDEAAEERALLRTTTAASAVATVLRSVVAQPLAAVEGAAARPFIVSSRVDNLSVRQVLHALLHPDARRAPRRVFFVHAHALNLAAFDADFARLLGTAELTLADGVGIRLAAAMLGTPLRRNLNGTDLFPELCAEAARVGVPLAFVGGKPGVADRAAARMREAHPGLSVPLVRHGFMDDAAVGELRDALRGLGRVVVLVGMGSPRQERWVEEHLADLPEVTALTVGGLFDFFSGDVARAPAAVRDLGLEWLFRMSQEPTRLARRYLLGNPLFLALAARQRLGLGR